MRRIFKLAIVPFWVLLFSSALQNLAYTAPINGKCVLKVDGKSYIDGPCNIEFEGKGAFTISSSIGKEYFASVFEPEGGLADGNWTGTGTGGLAERFDAPLKRKGACWENATARVCAYH